MELLRNIRFFQSNLDYCCISHECVQTVMTLVFRRLIANDENMLDDADYVFNIFDKDKRSTRAMKVKG